jgi:pentose-5-phosphate-3-epimerase
MKMGSCSTAVSLQEQQQQAAAAAVLCHLDGSWCQHVAAAAAVVQSLRGALQLQLQWHLLVSVMVMWAAAGQLLAQQQQQQDLHCQQDSGVMLLCPC